MSTTIENKNLKNDGSNKTKRKRLGLFSILFVCLYLFLEITFNISLVDFSNSKNTEIARFDQLELLGRVLSSLGLSLFIVNLFKIKHLVYNAGLIIILSVGMYFTQNHFFNQLIDNMSPQAKVQAYSLGVYRNLYINNEIPSNDGSVNIFINEDTTYNQVLNSMIGAVLLSDEMNDKVEKHITNFFDVNFSIPSEALYEFYDRLDALKNNTQTEELWKFYVIENKRFNNYQGFFKNEYENRFKNAIGMSPNLTKEEFLSFIQSQQKENFNLDELVVVPENKALGLKPLLVKDIPSYLNRDEWVNYVNKYIDKQIDHVKLNTYNIDNLPHSRAIIASVVIVPIAIVLSFLSIVLNICTLLNVIHRKISYFVIIVFIGAFIVHLFINNHYSLPVYANSMINLEKYNVMIFSDYKQFLHNKLINDEAPNDQNIIRVEKPQFPDVEANYTELRNKFEEFNKQTSEFENGNKLRQDLKIDDKKLENTGYYGELNKENPYK